MLKRFSILLLVFAMPVAWAQEIAYVTDILRLGIHRAQDTSDRPIRNLVSGTELTVLERTTNYARVRASDGTEGWVRSAFIVSDKPAQLRVAEVTADLEAARLALAAAEEAKTEAETSTSRLNQELMTKIAAADAVQDRLSSLEEENATYGALVDRYRGSVPLLWVAGALVVVFVGGVVSGTWWLDRSIRARFGGHRPY